VDFAAVLQWSVLVRSGRVEEMGEEEITTPILREMAERMRGGGARPVFFFSLVIGTPHQAKRFPRKRA